MASPKSNNWYKVTKLNLAVSARRAGFDLAIFDDYSPTVQKELKKHTVKQMMVDFRQRVGDELNLDLNSFDKAVYVLSLAYPLSVKYPLAPSHVIYIGMGQAGSRIEAHFKRKLFDFMQSLSGTEYNVHLALPKRAGSPEYYKHVEHLMLDYFAEEYGGASRCFPILNKNRGSDKRLSQDTEWWTKAIDRVGRKPMWTLNPTEVPQRWKLD